MSANNSFEISLSGTSINEENRPMDGFLFRQASNVFERVKTQQKAKPLGFVFFIMTQGMPEGSTQLIRSQARSKVHCTFAVDQQR
jgi:hypothetical protein